jgi:hypothetical protein
MEAIKINSKLENGVPMFTSLNEEEPTIKCLNLSKISRDPFKNMSTYEFVFAHCNHLLGTPST